MEALCTRAYLSTDAVQVTTHIHVTDGKTELGDTTIVTFATATDCTWALGYRSMQRHGPQPEEVKFIAYHRKPREADERVKIKVTPSIAQMTRRLEAPPP